MLLRKWYLHVKLGVFYDEDNSRTCSKKSAETKQAHFFKRIGYLFNILFIPIELNFCNDL